MTDDGNDEWAAHVETSVDDHYASLRGRCAPTSSTSTSPHTSLPVLASARRGHEVTIADPSEEVRDRVRLVQCSGQDAPAALGETFDGVLCHGVVMYVEDPDPFIGALADLAAPGGIVSIVAKNADVLAARPAHEGRWADALAAFDADRQVNGLGIDTRADGIGDLSALLARHDVDPVAWYGVRLFTDAWAPDRPPEDPEDVVLAVELEASRRDPYRQLSRLFHLVGQRRSGS